MRSRKHWDPRPSEADAVYKRLERILLRLEPEQYPEEFRKVVREFWDEPFDVRGYPYTGPMREIFWERGYEGRYAVMLRLDRRLWGIGYIRAGELLDKLYAHAGALTEVRAWGPDRTEMSGRKDWDPRHQRRRKVPSESSPYIQDFLDSFLEAALWASTDPETEEPLDRHYTTRDIAPDTMARLLDDAFAFLEQNYEDVVGRLEDAGRDFWFTRNGHGTGFWDGDWPEPAASRLTESAKQFGEVDLIIGDDRKIHAL